MEHGVAVPEEGAGAVDLSGHVGEALAGEPGLVAEVEHELPFELGASGWRSSAGKDRRLLSGPELAELFSAARSTVYRAIDRARTAAAAEPG